MKGELLIRTIRQQFNYCISKSTKTGQSKHSAKKSGTYKNGELYGNKTVEAYRDTAKNLSNWLAENHPEIKEVREITPEHIQEWVNARGENWSEKTLENHLSRIKFLEQQAQRAYGKDKVKFYDKNIKSPEVKKEKVKDKAMSRDDLNRLKETMKEARSFSKDALEISSRCGLRVDEVAHLKAEHINLDNKTLYVSPEGAKNGRERVVPIRDKDITYFRELKNRSPVRGYLTNINAKSIDKSIRRYMNQTTDNRGENLGHKYPRETIHSIRKLYATERMRELRGNEPLADKREEMKCWDTVSHELGHGAGRENLYRTYCKG